MNNMKTNEDFRDLKGYISEALANYNDQFMPPDNTSASETRLFQGTTSLFSSSPSKTTHWSIAWSDLMMTMFILFLSLFVYQTTHKDFLVNDHLNVIGGKTIDGIIIEQEKRAALPYRPIKAGAPVISNETIKKIEPIYVVDIDAEKMKVSDNNEVSKIRVDQAVVEARKESVIANNAEVKLAEQLPPLILKKRAAPFKVNIIKESELTGENNIVPGEINNLYILINKAIVANNLKDEIKVDFDPNKAISLFFGGDYLFAPDTADIRTQAEHALKVISEVLQSTPFRINVHGHTDDVPVFSDVFHSNWAFSSARASNIAAFMIEKGQIKPEQFVVSGFASYKPLVPNSNDKNRAINRRIEIIIDNYLPSPPVLTASINS